MGGRVFVDPFLCHDDAAPLCHSWGKNKSFLAVIKCQSEGPLQLPLTGQLPLKIALENNEFLAVSIVH